MHHQIFLHDTESLTLAHLIYSRTIVSIALPNETNDPSYLTNQDTRKAKNRNFKLIQKFGYDGERND